MGSKKKILVVFGTRPEALKMIPVIKELKKSNIHFITKICITGQHKDMLDQVLDLFKIKPDFDLNLMTHNQTLSSLTSKILISFEKVLKKFNPHLVLVHGDTNTTFSVSLSCFYNRISVGHVEAGLRTFNLNSPWPEEFNRQITSKLSNFHFAPTNLSKSNLLNENFSDKKIIVTGNTIIDTLFLTLKMLKKNKEVFNYFNKEHNINFDKKIILITGHRRENFGEGFLNICDALIKLSKKYPEIDFVYPVHQNPNVKNVVLGKLSQNKNIMLIQPLDYVKFVFLMSKSNIILTDSGGIQEEAPSLNIPVLVMRDTTERPEAIQYNKVKMVGTNSRKIVKEITNLLNDKKYYDSFLKKANPYGDGKSSKKIVKYLIQNKNVY